MAFSKPVLEFWAKPTYPIVPAALGAGLAMVGRKDTPARRDRAARWAIGGLAIGIAVMLYSRRALGETAMGDGWTAFLKVLPVAKAASTAYAFSVGDIAKLRDAADAQIELAQANQRLSVAPSDSRMSASAQNAAGAYLKTAYWLAVAARLEGPTSTAGQKLLAYAVSNYRKGTAAGLTYASESYSAVSTIFTNAGAAIRKNAISAKAQGVANTLLGSATEEAIAARKAESAAASVGGASSRVVSKLVERKDEAVEGAGKAGEAALDLPRWVYPSVFGVAALGLIALGYIAFGGKTK